MTVSLEQTLRDAARALVVKFGQLQKHNHVLYAGDLAVEVRALSEAVDASPPMSEPDQEGQLLIRIGARLDQLLELLQPQPQPQPAKAPASIEELLRPQPTEELERILTMSIEELERILNSEDEDKRQIEIMPDGRVRVTSSDA